MSTQELEILVPQPRVLDLVGERLAITPLVLGELPAMVKAVRPFAERMGGEPDWLALFSEHGDALLTALAIASRQPRAWVDSLALDDALALAAAVFEVNADFFVSRIAPKVGELAERLSERLAGVRPSPA